MRILFLGTAEFACPSLEALLKSSHALLGVVTQPDRPSGRGRKTIPSPVKSLALKTGLPVYQPEKLRDSSSLELLRSIGPELMVVVAYGQILSAAVLAIPPRGCVNVHGSLLPKYRGAAPIARAILAGETRTGVTTMFLDPGMDTGPILLAEAAEIADEDTAGTVHDRLSRTGADLLLLTLDRLEGNLLVPVPQDSAHATCAPKIEKEDAAINWAAPARHVFNALRAFDPWPGAFTTWQAKKIKLFRPRLQEGKPGAPPGTVIRAAADGLLVSASGGLLLIREVQLESRPRMAAGEFLKGYSVPAGTLLGT